MREPPMTGGARSTSCRRSASRYLYADRYDDAERSFDAARDLGLCGNNPFFVAWHWNARLWIEHRTGSRRRRRCRRRDHRRRRLGRPHDDRLGQHLCRARPAPSRVGAAGPRARRRRAATVTARGGSMLPRSCSTSPCRTPISGPAIGDPAADMRVHADYWRADEVTIAEAVAIEIVALGETLPGSPGRAAIRRPARQARRPTPEPVARRAWPRCTTRSRPCRPATPTTPPTRRGASRSGSGQPYDVQVLEALDVLAWACGGRRPGRDSRSPPHHHHRVTPPAGMGHRRLRGPVAAIRTPQRDRHRRVPRRRTLGVRA